MWIKSKTYRKWTSIGCLWFRYVVLEVNYYCSVNLGDDLKWYYIWHYGFILLDSVYIEIKNE